MLFESMHIHKTTETSGGKCQGELEPIYMNGQRGIASILHGNAILFAHVSHNCGSTRIFEKVLYPTHYQ